MKLCYGVDRAGMRPLVLAIGFFDGLHLGHRALMRDVLRLRKPGWRAGVLTFANHPASFLRPGTEPPLICTMQERIVRLAHAGLDECFLLQFDASVALLEPAEFVERVLINQLGVRAVVVGATFRFGHKRAGDVQMLAKLLAPHGALVLGVENLQAEGERISSTRIRALIAAGELGRADALLGESYEVRGVVELGRGRGHNLGFPTANLKLPEKLLPRDGVYAAVARYDGRDYAALVSIGTNPTFGAAGRTIEAWLRDFRQTIYGREIALRELRFVRAQRTFPNEEALVAQMNDDLNAVAYPDYAALTTSRSPSRVTRAVDPLASSPRSSALESGVET
ncbi:MAG: riboflavin biosynthesis protein RibF [Vulcanimicrobiaceae bacterium]